jgi:hypothetical protein
MLNHSEFFKGAGAWKSENTTEGVERHSRIRSTSLG